MSENKIAPEISDYLATIGKKGGSVKSERKTAAVRKNGRKGGRKPLNPDEMTEAQKQRQARYRASKEKTNL